ncbi:response regulator [bacterium]|jgi:adenylate cyclase|nr:response regulator [bacterium]MBT4251675.1 response regulator [bacterium]MBT4597725.1 response regulator [bacterium]MBT6753737.1 response regulator [bacterium]MBT7037874.1 response regulator [bacterium]
MTNITDPTQFKICIIEDEESIRELYRIKLESEHYQVFTAKDGLEGLELLRKTSPNLALIDLMMPNMNGFEMMEKMKADPELKNIPIVILTNFDDTESINKTSHFDADFYLVKAQYSPSDVARIVKEVLDSHHEFSF